MTKAELKKIAAMWSKATLLAAEFTDPETIKLLSEDEIYYLQNQVFKIAQRVTKLPPCYSLNDTIKEIQTSKIK